MSLSGNSSIASTLYLIYQTFTLLIIATPLGIGIGVLVAPLSNYWMYQYLNVGSFNISNIYQYIY
ncbi:hypothetical protein SD457_15315 [Coprobacillaceae bacterium CR2/5/TPMF4]|nr:hypothetical protein SD457_15315 [Coprobacillaceae bacterium CR2/5/TPMF4]